MTISPLLIAVDGPAASGKGTLAARLAAHFSLPHLDTGLLYRAVGKKFLLAREQALAVFARGLELVERRPRTVIAPPAAGARPRPPP